MDIGYFPLWQTWGLTSDHSDTLWIYVPLSWGLFVKWRLCEGSVILTNQSITWRCFFACSTCHKPRPRPQFWEVFPWLEEKLVLDPRATFPNQWRWLLDCGSVEWKAHAARTEGNFFGRLHRLLDQYLSLEICWPPMKGEKSVILLRRWEQMCGVREKVRETKESLGWGCY